MILAHAAAEKNTKNVVVKTFETININRVFPLG